MSLKWRQVKAWDDQHLRGPLWPVKLVLRLFSSITLAVILLVLVALYGTSASVPIGLVALFPTYLVYAATLLLPTALFVACFSYGLSLVIHTKWWRSRNPLLFAGGLSGSLAIIGATIYAWSVVAWPRLVFDPVNHTGLRLFASFVDEYSSITLRRLPGMEMSELEYYAWWPLRIILLLFVLNMVVSTLRRIEFTFKNIGVLTVHTGIVTIAMGSIYYSGLKREGDTILLAGAPDPATGDISEGPAQDAFYDNTRVALYLNSGDGWEQRLLRDLPRYNDYGLSAIPGESAWKASGRALPWDTDHGRTLDLPVGAGPPEGDTSLHARIVGYCSFAKTVKDWINEPLTPGAAANPLRIVYMHSSLPDDSGKVSDDPVLAFTLTPGVPAERVSEKQGAFSLEYTMGPSMGMSDERWADLSEPLPEGTLYALIVEVPGAGKGPAQSFRAVYPIADNTMLTVGDTGYHLSIKKISPQPPFPIITEGFRGAQSSVAVVTVAKSAANVAPDAIETFERFVYHRFPQINQDMLSQVNERGMPKRRDADPAIRLSLIDASQLNVYIDERPDGTSRAIIRQKGGRSRIIPSLAATDRLDQVVDKISLSIGTRWPNARQIERPVSEPIEEQRKNKDAIGTHDKAMIAVRLWRGDDESNSLTTWVPFSKFFGLGPSNQQMLSVGGKPVSVGFGRLQHQLPGFVIKLQDFNMLAYDHRGAPRDYQSLIHVLPAGAEFEPYSHITKLNAPLTAPFIWNDDRNWFANIIGTFRAGLSPYQFKFSQAGWDAQGWQRTQALVDSGQAKKPHVSFTILGVGNNPGIHIIALGGILMGLGIPWAFYIKPWLVQREKARIQAQLRDGTFIPPRRSAPKPSQLVSEPEDAAVGARS